MMLTSISAKLYAMISGVLCAVVVVVGVGLRGQQEADRERVEYAALAKEQTLGDVSTALVAMHLWTQSGVTALLSSEREDIERDSKTTTCARPSGFYQSFTRILLGF